MKIIPIFISMNILIIGAFPIFATDNIDRQHDFLKISDENCYGFIVPLAFNENETIYSNTQYATMNLINDLVRIKIPVYWTSNDITVTIRKINTNNIEKKTFTPGTFIIPFTEESSTNNKICAMINDYNYSHELHQSIATISSFMILEPFTFNDLYEINEPRISYYFGDGVYINSLNWYVSTLYRAGFLSNTLLNDSEIVNKLNNNDFNVFIWPGGEIVEDINSDISLPLRIAKNQAIKDFVYNGGGYVGSCYGAFAASSGMRVLPFPIIKFFFPQIPSIGYLSIQDSMTGLAISCSVNISIEDVNHPVLFGSNKILYDSQIRGGPVFTYVGKNTKSLATVQDVNSTIWTHWFRDLFSQDSPLSQLIINLWIKFTVGKTIWTTSEFGNGKIVIFGDHPEIGNIELKRIIHNSLLYVTSESHKSIKSESFLPVQQVLNTFKQSTAISINTASSDIFMSYYDSIDQILNDFKGFETKSDEIYNLTWSLIQQNKMNYSLAMNLFISGLWEFSRSLDRSESYLKSNLNDEDTIDFLLKINDIQQMMKQQNISIDDQINQFKQHLSFHLNEIHNITENITKNLNILEYNLEHYSNTNDQNNSMIYATENLWDYSKRTEKNCPKIYFESLALLRQIWYQYESILIDE